MPYTDPLDLIEWHTPRLTPTDYQPRHRADVPVDSHPSQMFDVMIRTGTENFTALTGVTREQAAAEVEHYRNMHAHAWMVPA